MRTKMRQSASNSLKTPDAPLLHHLHTLKLKLTMILTFLLKQVFDSRSNLFQTNRIIFTFTATSVNPLSSQSSFNLAI